MLNVGSPVNKQTDNLMSPLEAGQSQGRVLVGLNLHKTQMKSACINNPV